MNKENMGERPSRSILKNDTTLPLLPSTNRLNRRVSFHPEVTLHKINFVPVQVDKRRETIAIIPLLRDNSDSGNSSIESRDDSNSITSDEQPISTVHEYQDQNLEANNDLINGNGIDKDSDDDLANFDGNTDDGEEETMELTGQFVPHPEVATNNPRDNDVNQADNASETTRNDERIENTCTNNELKNVSGHNADPAADDIDPPTYYQDEEEGDMELTSNIGLNHQTIVNMDENNVEPNQSNAGQNEQDSEKHKIPNSAPDMNIDSTSAPEPSEHRHEESMDISAYTNGHKDFDYSIKVNDDKDQQTHQLDDNDLEETIDITKLYSQINTQDSADYQENDNFNQETTMDITRIYHQENRHELINDMSNADPKMQYNDDLKIPENESIMEFTQEIGKINISDTENVNQLRNIQLQEIENDTDSNNENIERIQEASGMNDEQPVDPNSKSVISNNIADDIHTDNNGDDSHESNEDEALEESEKTENGHTNRDNQSNEPHSGIANKQLETEQEQEKETNVDSQCEVGTSVNETIQNVEKGTQDSTYMKLTQIDQDSEAQDSVKADAHLEADQPSQNMQLTQEYGEIKQTQPKRKIDDIEPIPNKYPKIDNHSNINKTITTTIPLADMSTESIDDDVELDRNYIPVSLNEFLKDISIRFYDDLEIGIKSVDRISISLPKINTEESYKFDEFVSAMNKIPLLELYDFSCKELTKNIKDGTVLFDQFNQFTMENNPRLFKQYYLSSPNEKLSMKSEFQLIKDYTRHQAKEVWYGWRTQLIKNLIIQLDEKRDRLVQDKQLLLKNLSLINGIHEQLKVKFDNLSNQLSQLLQIEKHCNTIYSNDLFALKTELAVTCELFKENQQTHILQNKEINKLNSTISDNKALINTFTDEINEVEKSLNSNKKYELSEIELLKLKFNFLQSFTKLNFKSMEGNKLTFSYIGVEITMNFADIHDLSNISYSVDQNSPTPFNNSFIMANICPKLFSIISGSTIVESFQNFKKLWFVLQWIDEDIHTISWKLPIVFIESQDKVIKFKIRYYCGKHNFKVELFVSINLSNLLDYPNNLQIRGQLIRSDTKLSQEFVVNNLLNDCVHNAFVNKYNQIVIDGL